MQAFDLLLRCLFSLVPQLLGKKSLQKKEVVSCQIISHTLTHIPENSALQSFTYGRKSLNSTSPRELESVFLHKHF